MGLCHLGYIPGGPWVTGALWRVWGRLSSPATSLCSPQVFEFGHVNRVTECTNLNEHSSRSHALLIVTVRGLDRSTGLRTTGGCCTASPSPGRPGCGIPGLRGAGC